MASHSVSAMESDERLAEVSKFREIFRQPEIGALLGAAGVFVLFTAINSEMFPSVAGVARILDPASTIGIMAVSVALLLIGGEFNLSIGVLTGTSGLIMGLLAVKLGWSVWPAMLISLIFAIGIGYLNGWLVIKTRLPSFIITLATSFGLRGANVGVTRLVTNQVRVAGIDAAPGFYVARSIFNTELQLFGVEFRTTIIWWIAITALGSWILLRTRYGNWIFGVGGDREAARMVGVPVRGVRIVLFVQTSVFAWLVGTMTALRLRSAVASQGIGQEFVYLISAVIGGCLLDGGYGSAIGASIGALIFGMVRVGIVFSGWDTDWFYSFLGIMLLGAVVVNDFTRRRASEVSVAAAEARTEGE